MKARRVVVACALVVLLGLLGRMDYEDARLEEQHYCRMVADGAWPDFRETYATVCATTDTETGKPSRASLAADSRDDSP